MAIYRGCTLLLNGFQLSDVVAYTPPALRITKKLFRAGNMNAPVPVDTGTEELTATYKVPGMDHSAFLLFGAVPGVKARLTIRRAYRGVMDGVTFLEEQVEGFISDISSDEHGADSRPSRYSLLVPADACRAAGAAGKRLPDVPPAGDQAE